MAFLKKHGHWVAYLIIAFGFSAALFALQEQTADKLYENSLRACERGNVIREVVYSNTKDALAQNPGAGFAGQLALLRSVPNVDMFNGTIDCSASISRP
jgi:hypothetical protein